jgi:restriction endonuclease Mrr
MRCIGICGVHDRHFTGDCERCENGIEIYRHFAEGLLRELDEEAKDGCFAGTKEPHWYAQPFTEVMWHVRNMRRWVVEYQKEPYGIAKDLAASAGQLVADLEAYQALRQEQRPEDLRHIRREVERILGVLTQIEQTPGTEKRVSVSPAEWRHPATLLDVLHRLSPSAFESVVADLLQAQGYAGVKIVGGANDRGVDIVCRDTDGSLIAVQCKRYDPNRPSGRVGAPVVQLLSAMALQRRAHRGILVTTATFTGSARKQAHDFDIELIDGEALVHQISAHPQVLQSVLG